jgi:hypothetical protein
MKMEKLHNCNAAIMGLRNSYKIFVEKPEEKRPPGKLGRRWEGCY